MNDKGEGEAYKPGSLASNSGLADWVYDARNESFLLLAWHAALLR
jgi:hypothetical protein